MSLVKWNKNQMFPRFDSIWDDFFGSSRELSNSNSNMQIGTRVPAVNVSETDQHYHLEVAIPGCKKEDFKIDMEDNVLTISSQRKEEHEEKDQESKRVTRREFSYYSFQRSFQLPDNVDEDNISAQYVDGLLKIDLPKNQDQEQQRKRQIEIH